MTFNVAMVGCGAIGQGVLDSLRHDRSIRFSHVIAPSDWLARTRDLVAERAPSARVTDRLDDGPDRPDVLVECAGHAAIVEHVLPALARGVPCMIVSVGALSAPGLAAELQAAAAHGKTQVQLLSGAIAGIDALAAARVGGLDSVIYTGRKPPSAWADTAAQADFDLAAMDSETLIFSGSARDAAALYPKNANVAATLSLAGVGLDRTQVHLWADPAVDENVHQVQAFGAFGSLMLTIRGKPLAANPKTSALTVYSVVRGLTNRAHALAI